MLLPLYLHALMHFSQNLVHYTSTTNQVLGFHRPLPPSPSPPREVQLIRTVTISR